jgi:hypothetical protein
MIGGGGEGGKRSRSSELKAREKSWEKGERSGKRRRQRWRGLESRRPERGGQVRFKPEGRGAGEQGSVDKHGLEAWAGERGQAWPRGLGQERGAYEGVGV